MLGVPMDDLRTACQQVAARAREVRIDGLSIGPYAASLPSVGAATGDGPPLTGTARELAAAATLQLDAINFGSGWFPTLRKRPGLSGYRTIAAALAEQHERHGPWTAGELTALDAAALGPILDQDPAHPLVALYAASLNDLGGRVRDTGGGSFTAVVDAAGGSAVTLARTLGVWPCFADVSRYEELVLPFLKRAQIAAADLQRAGVDRFDDLGRLTMFADNLVPHVLRLDGVLHFSPALTERIERQDLIAHDSPAEIEIRACAVHAVELIVAARPGARACDVDEVLWERGGEPAYKAVPRHRSRCSAY